MLVGLESTISNEGRYNLTELRERVEDCIFVKLWKMQRIENAGNVATNLVVLYEASRVREKMFSFKNT
jgi:hypothetical protein